MAVGDNNPFECVGDFKDTDLFNDAAKLAFRSQDHSFEHFKATNDGTRIIFYWTDSGEDISPLGYTIETPETFANFCFNWLRDGNRKWPKEPDIDGHSILGWRFRRDYWGNVDGESGYGAAISLETYWVMMGK